LSFGLTAPEAKFRENAEAEERERIEREQKLAKKKPH